VYFSPFNGFNKHSRRYKNYDKIMQHHTKLLATNQNIRRKLVRFLSFCFGTNLGGELK